MAEVREVRHLNSKEDTCMFLRFIRIISDSSVKWWTIHCLFNVQKSAREQTHICGAGLTYEENTSRHA